MRELAQAPPTTPSALETAARWLALLGAAIIGGGLAFYLLVVLPATAILAPGSAEAVRRASFLVLLASVGAAVFLLLQGSLFQLLLQADRFGGLALADDLLVDTRFGRFLLLRQVLLGVIVIGLIGAWLLRGRRLEMPLLAFLLLTTGGLLTTFSLVSHAAIPRDGVFWSTLSDYLHLAAASIWIGGLAHISLLMPPLLKQLRAGPRILFAAEAFRRFSVVAATSVVLLLASGIINGMVEVPTWDDIWTSAYGQALAFKIALGLGLLGVAAINAFLLRPKVVAAAMDADRGPPSVAEGRSPGVGASSSLRRLQRRLAQLVRLEALLAVAVLAAVAVLTQLPSPRSTLVEPVAAQPLELEREEAVEEGREIYRTTEVEDGLFVVLTLSPGRVGDNRYRLDVVSQDVSRVVALEGATFQLQPDSASEATIEVELNQVGLGQWEGEAELFDSPGPWRLTLTLPRQGLPPVQVDFRVSIGGGASQPSPPAVASGGSNLWAWPLLEGFGANAPTAIVVTILAAAWSLALFAFVRHRLRLRHKGRAIR